MSQNLDSILIEPVEQVSDVQDFLKQHEESSQFLINNLREYGPRMTEEPYSGNFKLIRENGQVTAVFCLARCGNLYAQASSDRYTEMIIKNCGSEIKGFLGPWNILGPLYEFYCAQNPSFKPAYHSKEILYSLELQGASIQQDDRVRLLTSSDFEAWFPMRKEYLIELGLSDHMDTEKVKERFLRNTDEQKNWWGLFENGELSSIAGLNSKSETIGQVGGVFTPPAKRKRGLSKATMLHMLRDCVDLHGLQKSILFTGQTDIAAQKLYESISYQRIGHFALILS
jgi:uncharacterized protein